MAKTFEIIKSFEGGINTNQNARDIGASEFVLLRQCNTKKQGVLDTIGGPVALTSFNTPTTADNKYTVGQGLYMYWTQYSLAGGTDGRRVLVMQNSADGKTIGFSQAQYDGTADNRVDYVLPWSSNGDPDFLFLENALRIYDRSHVNSNAQWFSYLDRDIFPSLTGATTDLDIAGWVMMDQQIHSPMSYDKTPAHVSCLLYTSPSPRDS